MTKGERAQILAVIRHVHSFASMTGARPGDDVLQHLSAKWRELMDESAEKYVMSRLVK